MLIQYQKYIAEYSRYPIYAAELTTYDIDFRKVVSNKPVWESQDILALYVFDKWFYIQSL